jgi:hypothetical protein
MRVEGLRNNAVGTIAITQVIMGSPEGRELLVGWNYPPRFCINYSFAAVCYNAPLRHFNSYAFRAR